MAVSSKIIFEASMNAEINNQRSEEPRRLRETGERGRRREAEREGGGREGGRRERGRREGETRRRRARAKEGEREREADGISVLEDNLRGKHER